jgi:two-component system, NtrC family, sensor kinase
VDIRDTGCGVTPDAREQLFTPFASTKREGTGLGLVVARGIVESHGGTLALLDGDGQPGATFRMTLPVPASAPNDPEPGAAGQAGDG